MFKEIQHQQDQSGLKDLQLAAKKIIETNLSIDKSKEIVKQLYSNKDEESLFKGSFTHICNLIVDLNKQRKIFFRKNGFLPAEFHHTLSVIQNKILVVEDSLTFKNARYSILRDDLQKVCDNSNFMLLPYDAVSKSLKIENELKEELKEQNEIYVLVHSSKLNLNDCLGVSDVDLMNAIVPQKISTKWESFVFQFPLYQEIYSQINDLNTKNKILNNSFTKMNEMIKTVLNKQEAINLNVNANLNVLFGRMNEISSERHSEKGLDKNKLITVPDYNNPTYEREEEGVGEYTNDWGYTNYERIIIRYVKRYPMINVTLYGQPYKNLQKKHLDNELAYLYDLYMKNTEVKNKELLIKAQNDAYMILKKDGDNEFKVITTMRGVDNIMGIMMDTSMFLPTNQGAV